MRRRVARRGDGRGIPLAADVVRLVTRDAYSRPTGGKRGGISVQPLLPISALTVLAGRYGLQ